MSLEQAQLPGRLDAALALCPAADAILARDAALELRGVFAGPDPLLSPGRSLLSLTPASLTLSAAKPAEDGDGFVVRVLNPTDVPQRARLELGFPLRRAGAVRLDESAASDPVEVDGRLVSFDVPPRALRSVLVVPEDERAATSGTR